MQKKQKRCLEKMIIINAIVISKYLIKNLSRVPWLNSPYQLAAVYKFNTDPSIPFRQLLPCVLIDQLFELYVVQVQLSGHGNHDAIMPFLNERSIRAHAELCAQHDVERVRCGTTRFIA